MLSSLKSNVAKKVQKVFWVHRTNNFVIAGADDFRVTEAARECRFIAITTENCSRVREFREPGRVSDYKQKLTRNEIGFFAECGGQVVGSIWATINRAQSPSIARGHMRLMPNEALVHDIVTGEKSRGMGVGPFMVGRIASALLHQYKVSKIVIDVNVKNKPSMRMMEKAGLQVNQRVFAVSVLGTLAFEKVLKRYA